MRRIATYLLLCAFAVLIVGCKNKGAGGLFGGSTSASTAAVDPYQAPTDAATYEPTTYPVYNQPAVMESTYTAAPLVADNSMAMESGLARYHTVTKRDTLYAIARTYYGDHRRWKDIYEANRSDIGDPNRIRIGQRLLIP